MTREEIVDALSAVGRLLHARGIEGELYAVGGAAIAFALDARRSTRDVDAVFEPKGAIYEAAAEVALALDLPPGGSTTPSRASSPVLIRTRRRCSKCPGFAVSLPPHAC
jgi:hypothetical protein